jgi:hypothetical protein
LWACDRFQGVGWIAHIEYLAFNVNRSFEIVQKKFLYLANNARSSDRVQPT